MLSFYELCIRAALLMRARTHCLGLKTEHTKYTAWCSRYRPPPLDSLKNSSRILKYYTTLIFDLFIINESSPYDTIYDDKGLFDKLSALGIAHAMIYCTDGSYRKKTMVPPRSSIGRGAYVQYYSLKILTRTSFTLTTWLKDALSSYDAEYEAMLLALEYSTNIMANTRSLPLVLCSDAQCLLAFLNDSNVRYCDALINTLYRTGGVSKDLIFSHTKSHLLVQGNVTVDQLASIDNSVHPLDKWTTAREITYAQYHNEVRKAAQSRRWGLLDSWASVRGSYTTDKYREITNFAPSPLWKSTLEWEQPHEVGVLFSQLRTANGPLLTSYKRKYNMGHFKVFELLNRGKKSPGLPVCLYEKGIFNRYHL